MTNITREACLQRDAKDPLKTKRDAFNLPADMIYLDGNSLGLTTKATQTRVREVVEQQWAQDVITSWNKHQWVDLPLTVGDKIGKLIGAAQGQVVCCDSISVNLFKVLAAALKKQHAKGESKRTKVISTRDNFPTDLYMVQGLSALVGEHQCALELVDEDKLHTASAEVFDETTAVVLVTEVNFRTGRRLPMADLIANAHAVGALVIVDLAHSAGAVPVALEQWRADFAVGCTYKYLNGGPGAPAFVYVAKRHQHDLQQPLSGWFGHAAPFAFDPNYRASADVRQMLSGTPPIIAMAAVDAALDVYADVDMQVIRDKSLQLTGLFQALLQQRGLDGELRCISPENDAERGSQLSYHHQHAYGLCQALIERNVIADFREPSYLRIGFTPLYTSYVDVFDAVDAIVEVLKNKEHLAPKWQNRNKVT